MSERIQKMLATAGVASRREIERLIDAGRITVNGSPAEPGQKIDSADQVCVDGRAVFLRHKPEPARVLIYKKRTGELVTRDDPEGRRTVFRKLPKLASGRWIAVGRLDINTSGLLLFTNHGELARRLTHPSFEIPRTYAARILGSVDAAVLARWKAGVELDDGKARFERVEVGENEDGEGANQWFRVTVREGRNRLVRRLIESQDLQVSRLIRLSYGPIELGRGNKSGTARDATPAELLALLDAVGLSEEDAGLETTGKAGRRNSGRRAEARAGDEEAAPSPRRNARASAPPGRAARGVKPSTRSGDRSDPARRDDDDLRPARGDGKHSPRSADRALSPAKPSRHAAVGSRRSSEELRDSASAAGRTGRRAAGVRSTGDEAHASPRRRAGAAVSASAPRASASARSRGAARAGAPAPSKPRTLKPRTRR